MCDLDIIDCRSSRDPCITKEEGEIKQKQFNKLNKIANEDYPSNQGDMRSATQSRKLLTLPTSFTLSHAPPKEDTVAAKPDEGKSHRADGKPPKHPHCHQNILPDSLPLKNLQNQGRTQNTNNEDAESLKDSPYKVLGLNLTFSKLP